MTCANGSKIIVNSQEPMQEIWLAAKAGGFHFRYVEPVWRNTKTGQELFESLSVCLSQQSGVPVRF
jgi:CyaY protein